jgi:hypothetical protein
MEYIQKHKDELFHRNINLMTEIKRVLDTKDIYLTSALTILIKQQSEQQSDLNITSQELQKSLWNYYIELFGDSDNIPVNQVIKPRRSH